MQFTVDRLNVLLTKHGLPEFSYSPQCPHEYHEWAGAHWSKPNAHVALNRLDGHRKIVTTGQVGARIRTHEKYGSSNISHDYCTERFYHWLGYDACCQCGCGEHKRAGVSFA